MLLGIAVETLALWRDRVHHCQPLVAAGEAIQTVAVLWTPLAVPWTLLAECWTEPAHCDSCQHDRHVLQLVAVHYSPPQSSWTVCVMGSSSTLLTWLHHNTLECWNEIGANVSHSSTRHCIYYSYYTHLYSASCKEFDLYSVHGTLWQDTLTKMAVWNSGRSSSRPSCRMDSLRVCVWASDGRECEGMPFRIGFLSHMGILLWILKLACLVYGQMITI